MIMFLCTFTGKSYFKVAVMLGLILLTATYTVPWVIRNSLGMKYSGIDFHGYWYAGHFIRQGVNSYAAILNNPNPNYWDPRIPGSGDPNRKIDDEYSLKLPIKYLDGYTVREYPVAQTLIVVPAVTAPLNLLIGLLSWFSWPVAREIWLVLNLIVALMIPWLAIRLTTRHLEMNLIDKLIFALVFYNFYGLRQSLVVGQQTLICLFLIILALLNKDKWLIAGVLLGIGISKYSVGLPVFLYFLLQRKYRVALMSLVIQVGMILLLAPLKWGSPINTVVAYLKIVAVNYSQNGVHLLARFSEQWIQIALFLAILCATVFLITLQYFYYKIMDLEGKGAVLNDLNLITLAIFLITYHRVHDMPFMVFFLLLATVVLSEIHNIGLSKLQTVLFLSSTGVIIFLLLFPTIPGQIISALGLLDGSSESWTSVEAMSSVAILMMFVLSAWLQLKFPLSGFMFSESK